MYGTGFSLLTVLGRMYKELQKRWRFSTNYSKELHNRKLSWEYFVIQDVDVDWLPRNFFKVNKEGLWTETWYKKWKNQFLHNVFVRPHKWFAWSFMTSVLSSEIEQKDRGRKAGGRHNLVSFRKGLHKKNRYLKISTFTVTAC